MGMVWVMVRSRVGEGSCRGGTGPRVWRPPREVWACRSGCRAAFPDLEEAGAPAHLRQELRV